MLVLVYRFQPSEIDALELQDFEEWCDRAIREIERRAKAQQG